MRVLQRIDSFSVLGIEVNRNMSIFILTNAMNIGLANNPKLVQQFNTIMTLLDAVKILNELIRSKMQIIIDLKRNLLTAKRALELAVKLYNVGSAASTKLLDVKPAANGLPPATGAEAFLAPLKKAVEDGTTLLQDLEDEINEALEELSVLNDQYKEDLDLAVDSLMDKIADLGKKNITIE